MVASLHHYSRVGARKAWRHSFTLNEIPGDSYRAIALNGEHGLEGASRRTDLEKQDTGAPLAEGPDVSESDSEY